MNKFSRIVGTLSFAAICLVALFIGARPARVATQPPQQNEAQKAGHQNLKIQHLTGDAARLRAQQLRKLSKGVARAMREAEKKGLREAFDQGAVVLASDPAKTAASLLGGRADTTRKVSFGAPPQETFYDGDYEVSFLPYDDGDPNKWEGIIYRTGPDIDEDTRYAVIDISTEDVAVSQETYYPPDGGDPCSTRECIQYGYQVAKHSIRPTAMVKRLPKRRMPAENRDGIRSLSRRRGLVRCRRDARPASTDASDTKRWAAAGLFHPSITG